MSPEKTSISPRQPALGNSVVISVDAMGGDRGPAAVVAGVAHSATEHPLVQFILHGPQAELTRLIAQHKGLAERCRIEDAEGVVTMQDKPSQVLRNGAGTSMWSSLESVRAGDAAATVSCGNTGALMALSMIRLRKLPGVNRPAIACLWPSRNPQGFNILLDVGADIRADAHDLLQYALMGASYARNGLGVDRPRVGLMNVGTEEHKGRPELKAAQELIVNAAQDANYDYIGFVEGGDMASSKVDVIVMDGFTGNIALKTGEGTAKLVGEFMRDAFSNSILSKFAALLAMSSLKRLQSRIDPRRVNGGVFLGLNGTVVKSHGSADATGVAAALRLAIQLAQSGFQDRLAARVAHALAAASTEANNNNSAAQPATGTGAAEETE